MVEKSRAFLKESWMKLLLSALLLAWWPGLYRFFMTAITERLRCSNFTATEKNFFWCRRLIFHWRKFGPFVRAIAKRLVLAEATCTPEIRFSWFNFNCKRGICCSFRVTHILISLVNILMTSPCMQKAYSNLPFGRTKRLSSLTATPLSLSSNSPA